MPITKINSLGVNLTSPLTFSAGTAALPSITFSGDTNTGVFAPAADTIGFTEGGTERMRIDSNGNVNITSTNSFTLNDGSFKTFGSGQKTVSTTTTLLTIDEPGGAYSGALVLVGGIKNDNGSIVFTDVVCFGINGAATVISSATANSPAARTYSVSGASLRVAMAANTYLVQSTAMRQAYSG